MKAINTHVDLGAIGEDWPLRIEVDFEVDIVKQEVKANITLAEISLAPNIKGAPVIDVYDYLTDEVKDELEDEAAADFYGFDEDGIEI